VGTIPFPVGPTVYLDTWCAGFSPAGAPYVFVVANLTVTAPTFPMNFYWTNVTATCTSYTYNGTLLRGTGCTYSPPTPPAAAP
jgi:hypothetical protein